MKSSPPEFSRSDVREWLNRVEDDFADNHRVVDLANPVELPDTMSVALAVSAEQGKLRLGRRAS
jgi:hypothetical protein